ncbi:MAG: L-asparaginase [Planctomycetota bacterium]|jgi:L-asparaginase
MSRVFVAYTGGTIGMLPGEDGFEPKAGEFLQLFNSLDFLGDPEVPEFEIEEFSPILDSANMRPDDWNRIALIIKEKYRDFDGFVILHGTDTMAYTASALSFMLEGLRKPVILTGSQIPLCRTRSDAHRNVVEAMMFAGHYSIPEVCIYFGGRLIRGNRATKVSSSALKAFDSPNFPQLGRVGTKFQLRDDLIRRSPHGALNVLSLGRSKVGALRLFPGMEAEILENMLRPPLEGLVLECYGAGNAPVKDGKIPAVIEAANERGVVVAISSQCPDGTVDLSGYATSSALARAGAIGGLDMTVEAMMTKMMYLIDLGIPADQVKHRMQIDLRGELSIS